MNIINPVTITADMFGVGTNVTEDPTAAWVSGTYAVNDERHLLSTHRVYRRASAGASTVSPDNDPINWKDMRPTNRWAPFDVYTSTKATTVTNITYVLTPGYFNAVALYGILGAQYSVVVKDTPGGAVIFSSSGFLLDSPVGWYEYLFGAAKVQDKLVLTGIPIRPTAELTITISSAVGQPVALGLAAIGDYASLSGKSDWGGAQYGASAEPVTYSYIKTNDDGSTSIVKRHSATNLRVTTALPREDADAVLASVQQVLDVPVAWIATDAQGFSGLTTFGIGSAAMKYDSYGVANLEITVKGLV